jgi:hypothetical protein
MSSIELINLSTGCLTKPPVEFFSSVSRNAIPLPTGRLPRCGADNCNRRCGSRLHKLVMRSTLGTLITAAQGIVEYFYHTTSAPTMIPFFGLGSGKPICGYWR